MKEKMNVILYCRVSTDEQADGCSLEIQERCLRAYCSNHQYNIVGIYKENYSAKHYDLRRPAFKKMYDYCRKHKKEIDKILFLRWDRYARNVEFAFTYKRKIHDELGIEINAIESPIEFAGTEWSPLLSLYCGVAHTEDEKISKRTKDGIHGTLMKGKWTHKAPRGYKNVRRSKHDCWIEIDEPEATKIRALFYEVAKGVETPTSICKRMYPKLAESTFFGMMRNRFYAGYVHVPAYGNDPEQDVRGQHEPLIDEKTSDEVQDILDGKKKKQPKLSKPADPMLYLRKFLVCPVCGHILTGAASKGNGGRYYYYFCNHDHKHLNIRAEKVNEGFYAYTSTLKPNEAVLALYNEILLDIRGDRVKENYLQADKLQEKVDVLTERENRVKDMFIDGEISRKEKEESLARYSRQKEELNERIQVLRLSEDMKIKDKLGYSLNIIANLGEFFKWAGTEVKIKLLGSIFPEKIEFDGKNYRTKNFNSLLKLIYKETKQLRRIKKKLSPEFSGDNGQVPEAGLEPARL